MDIYLLGMLVGLPIALITSPLVVRLLEKYQDRKEVRTIGEISRMQKS